MIIEEGQNKGYGRRRINGRRGRRAVYMRRLAISLLIFVTLVVAAGAGVLVFSVFKEGNKTQAANTQQQLVSETPKAESDSIEELSEIKLSVKPETMSKPEALSEPVVSPEPIPESQEEEEHTIVVLDAGHGGNDGGTFKGDIIEKEINLSVALKIKELLEEEEIEVVLTRENDKYMDLKDRVKAANSVKGGDLFVSVHCNSYEADTGVRGLECYYFEDSEIGKTCAETIIGDLKSYGEIRVRSAKPNDYFVLKFNDLPSVLVEMGFLTNAEECKKLASEDYQEIIAEGLVEGILDCLDMCVDTQE